MHGTWPLVAPQAQCRGVDFRAATQPMPQPQPQPRLKSDHNHNMASFSTYMHVGPYSENPRDTTIRIPKERELKPVAAIARTL